VVLLTVIQPPAVVADYPPIMENITEIRLAGEKFAANHLARYEERLVAAEIPVETVQLYGSPIPLIIEHAQTIGADYIVMGSHGHTAFYDLLVGSTTHGVLTRAACPVVIVPAKEKKRAKPKKELHAIA
jgi:nucleotide-binding universal stress UspA family protein